MSIYELSLAGVNVAEGINRFGGSAEICGKYVFENSSGNLA